MIGSIVPQMAVRHATLLAVAAVSIVTLPRADAQQAVNPPARPPQELRDANGNLLPGAAPAPNQEATTDRVFVTGSAIPTAQEVGPNPVLTATREAIREIR
jgi:hypothetical protein